MRLTERFDWRGRRIAWGRTGSGPALVFCHGTPFSSLLWQPFAAALSRDFTVYLWDMPGYGLSSKHVEHPVDFGVQADAFEALLTQWGLDRPHVIAHDFGGAVSLRTHLIGEAAYSSLLLVDVVALPPSGSPFFQFVKDNPGVMPNIPSYVHEAIVRAYIQGASHHGLDDDDVDALVRPWTGDDGQPAFYRQIADYDERFLEENEQRLGQIDIPVHIVWGTQDAWIPAERGEKLQRLIPGATLALIDDAGHLMQRDAPVQLMSEIRVWLQSVERRTLHRVRRLDPEQIE